MNWSDVANYYRGRKNKQLYVLMDGPIIIGHAETISAPHADGSRKLGGFRSTKKKFYANNTFKGNLLRVENNPKFKMIENLGYYARDCDGVVFILNNDNTVDFYNPFFLYPSPRPQ
jgi:hypothetical protein